MRRDSLNQKPEIRKSPDSGPLDSPGGFRGMAESRAMRPSRRLPCGALGRRIEPEFSGFIRIVPAGHPVTENRTGSEAPLIGASVLPVRPVPRNVEKIASGMAAAAVAGPSWHWRNAGGAEPRHFGV